MSAEITPEKGQSKSVGTGDGSAKGFWRSPTGENHGRDSRPGDVWHEPGDITDTDRLNWLIAGGYCPAEWRPATCEELRAGLGRDNGQIMVGIGDRRTIDAAMLRDSTPNTKLSHERGAKNE